MSNAFRPKGVSGRPGPRQARQASDYPRDRLAVVDSYDLSRGVMIAKEMDTDLKLEVSIQERAHRPAASTVAASTRNASERKWSGNKIDALMAESLVPGSWVILESTRGNESIMRGKERILPVAARWITNVTEPRPDKCFTGIFTATAYHDEIKTIQAWDDKALDVSDEQALEQFGAELDAVHAAWQNRERPIRRGFQFRIVKLVSPATEGQDGKPGRPASYEVVDMSYPIDWVNSESDNPDDLGAPPTNEQFQSYVNGYIDHIWGSQDGSTPAKFPAEDLEQMRFEIATYRQYKAGSTQYNERMALPEKAPGRFPSPERQLVETATRYSKDDEFVVGKNWAVRGILLLINDTFDKKANPPVVVQNFMARQLFANGPRANVQSMIATSDGGRAKVIPELDRVLERREDQGPQRSAAAPAPAPADALTAVEDPFGAAGFMDDSEVFGGDAPVASPEPAPAPAPAPAASPEPAAAAPAPARGGNRPGRFHRTSA